MLFIILFAITLVGFSVCYHYHLVDKAKTVSDTLLRIGKTLEANDIINVVGSIKDNLTKLRNKPSDFKYITSLLKSDYSKLYQLVNKIKF